MTTEHSGSGDAARSMELLWGTGERPTRGPKPGLTLDRIVTAAVAVADAEGIGAVSMRRVAAELGVGTMSLYRYVPGKGELLDLMLDKIAAFGADGFPGPEAGWRAVLENVARRAWRLHHLHPWLLQVDQTRPLLGPNSVDVLEHTVRGMSGLALPDPQKMRLLTVVEGYVAGAARTRLNSAMAEKRTGATDEEWWKIQGPFLVKAMETGRYPHLAGLSEDTFSFEDDCDDEGDALFELGLGLLLDGFAAYIEKRDG
ncbi:TetR/AcrR family transcriptional regulator [Streptomyces paromomycinus]|uniref:TetR family transcriptional regulator n=1 Tax=Streptomyces paromomycinus TaxID=92743 RepID=A0A401W2Z1_STREY|nr:TetR/AcrR family transcriptional regulator [Streptomyces paromomycinus]GCD43666.1 TetR family transcriptional regulator [Streptomyces paromomycinus]